MIFVDFGHSVPKMIFIRPPQVQKCPTFPFSCLNQTLNLPSIRQLNASWVIIGGVCTDVFGQNDRRFHTKYFFNRLKFFYLFIRCVCVISSLSSTRALTLKTAQICPNPEWARYHLVSERGILQHTNPLKKPIKTHFITRKTVINRYLLTKKD